MPLLARVKSSKLPNEGWFETDKLLKLINETLLLMGMTAKSEGHSQVNLLIDDWIDGMLAHIEALFTPEFGQYIGVLAKKIRSNTAGWIDFCEEDWQPLKKICLPQNLGKQVTLNDRQRIIKYLNTIRNKAKSQCTDPQPNEVMAVGIAELLFNEQLQQFYLLHNKKHPELDKAAAQLIQNLSQVIALEATPLTILKMDEKYYHSCKRRHGFAEVALQIAEVITRFSQSSNELACIKEGHPAIEKQGLIVTHIASQLISEFNLKTSEQSLKAIKHKLAAQRKGLQQKTERIASMQGMLNHSQGENELLKQQLKIEGELLEVLRQQFVTKNANLVQLKAKIQQIRTEKSVFKKEAQRLQAILDKERSSQVIPFKSRPKIKR